MKQTTELPIDQSKLVAAWNQSLPRMMNPTDQAEVKADEG